ncbi:hypothetical protein JCM25156A_31000 [Komagataeibacter kakiaceti JCM 25156]
MSGGSGIRIRLVEGALWSGPVATEAGGWAGTGVGACCAVAGEVALALPAGCTGGGGETRVSRTVACHEAGRPVGSIPGGRLVFWGGFAAATAGAGTGLACSGGLLDLLWCFPCGWERTCCPAAMTGVMAEHDRSMMTGSAI